MASSNNLIFLHGWGASPCVWEKQIVHFSKKYKTEAPSICHPEPRRGEGSLRFFGLRPQNDIREVLIGWSYGGMRAIEMVAREPKGYKALVLVASSAKFSEGMHPAVIKNIMRNLKKDFDATMKDCYATFFSDKENDLRERFISGQALPDRNITIEILRELLTMDLRESLNNINIPALIIHGDKDAVCPLEGGRFLHKGIKGSRLSVVKDAGHAPFYTKAEEFNRILEGFLETLD